MNHPVFFYAALCGLILIGLSLYVVFARGTLKIGIGDGCNPEMLLRMHANFIEYVPFSLLLIYSVQLAGYSLWMVHTLGASLIVPRLAHIAGLRGSRGRSPGRFVGIVGTLLIILAAALLSGIGSFGERF